MRTIAKPFLSATAFLVALLLALTLLLNAWLQLPGTREGLRAVANKACGTGVSFRRLYGLPWGEIWITGLSTETKDPRVRFTADAARIRISPVALLSGKISISSCSLDHPFLALPVCPPLVTRQEGIPETPSLSFGLGSSPLPIPSPAPLPLSPESSSGQGRTPPVSIFSSQCTIAVHHGEFRLTDTSSKPIVTFTGVNLAGEGTSAQVTANKAIVDNSLFFRDLKGTLISRDGSLALRDLRAVIGGGSITGTVDYLDAFTSRPQYRLGLEFQGGDLNRLLAEAAYPSTSAKGSVSGKLSLLGLVGQGTTMQGAGTLLLKEASLQPADFLRQIGRILNIEELQLLRISEGKCLFRIESGELRVEDLLLRSDNLILAAMGQVSHNGNLDLKTRLLFNEKLTSRLRGMIGSQLVPSPEPGYTQVAFRVTGPAINPKTDLLERLTGIHIGGDLGGLGHLLQGLFGQPSPTRTIH